MNGVGNKWTGITLIREFSRLKESHRYYKIRRKHFFSNGQRKEMNSNTKVLSRNRHNYSKRDFLRLKIQVILDTECIAWIVELGYEINVATVIHDSSVYAGVKVSD